MSAASLAGVNTPLLTYTLVGAAFVITKGIIVYHFHISYTAKSAWWLQLRGKVLDFAHFAKGLIAKNHPTPQLTDAASAAATSSHDPHKIVTYSVIDMREPLLENKRV